MISVGVRQMVVQGQELHRPVRYAASAQVDVGEAACLCMRSCSRRLLQLTVLAPFTAIHPHSLETRCARCVDEADLCQSKGIQGYL
jgi:hypothetical protein